MTIEAIAESIKSYQDKAYASGTGNKRIRYPDSLKTRAINYYKANPDLTPSKMAKMIGISGAAGDRWFKRVKQISKVSEPKESAGTDFIELRQPSRIDEPSFQERQVKVRIIEITLPSEDPSKLFSALKAIVQGES